MAVRILEDHVVNQIAAGEVVERPASVVKELLENALDAGARTVRVSLRGGGRNLVRITDDGSGMDRDDALMCLERHATSKIRRAEDLESVGTLGFRGEAIPSIAAVSRFQLLTRPHDRDVGTRIRIEGGTIRDVSDAGCAAGTEIDVRQLFHNLPARRKFLRTAGTELSHCLEAVVREALVRPDVDFAVFHEDRESMRAPTAPDRATRARDLLGPWGRSLLPVSFDEGGLTVEGLVSPVGVHKSTPTGGMYLYVNGRYVRDAVLRRAVNEAYRELVPKGRYAVVVVDVRMDPSTVDVNVHPSKVEVRFHDPRSVSRIVAEGLRAALEDHGIRRPVQSRAPESVDPRAPVLPLGGMSAPPPTGPLFAADAEPPGSAEPPRPPAPRGVPVHPDDDLRFGSMFKPSRPADPVAALIEDLPPPPARSSPPPVQRHLDRVDAARILEAPRLEGEGRAVASEPEVLEPQPLLVSEPARPPEAAEGHRLLPVPRFRDLRVIGQLADSYLLCEGAGELVVIDQHAAHERVLLHRLLADRAAVLGGAQRLLAPVPVELPRARMALLAERLDVLEALGLEAEVFGPREIAVKAIPPLLKGVDLARLLSDLADELATDAGERAGEDLMRGLLATMACHHAVRARQPLTDYAMRALLASLDEVDFEVCAHGRPVAIRIDAHELERRFHRA